MYLFSSFEIVGAVMPVRFFPFCSDSWPPSVSLSSVPSYWLTFCDNYTTPSHSRLCRFSLSSTCFVFVSKKTFFAEQAEAGWPELRRSLSAAEGAGFSPRADMARGGLAFLVAAHSRYISNMFLHMFLGNDRPSIVARAQVEEFYEVVCTVSRVTDGLLLAPSVSGDVQKDEEETNLRRVQDIVGEMVLPNEAFAELASVRGRFDAAKRELCGALLEISAAGGGARARPLLAILGYGGYGGGDVA